MGKLGEEVSQNFAKFPNLGNSHEEKFCENSRVNFQLLCTVTCLRLREGSGKSDKIDALNNTLGYQIEIRHVVEFFSGLYQKVF